MFARRQTKKLRRSFQVAVAVVVEAAMVVAMMVLAEQKAVAAVVVAAKNFDNKFNLIILTLFSFDNGNGVSHFIELIV